MHKQSGMLVLKGLEHRLNMELDLPSLFGLLCTALLIGCDPATLIGLIYEGAIGQPRQTTSLCDPPWA